LYLSSGIPAYRFFLSSKKQRFTAAGPCGLCTRFPGAILANRVRQVL
jgi:hypothetical protein